MRFVIDGKETIVEQGGQVTIHPSEIKSKHPAA